MLVARHGFLPFAQSRFSAALAQRIKAPVLLIARQLFLAQKSDQKLLERLPVTGEILRGSLLHRIIWPHGPKYGKCASGEGHRLNVLTVTYPGGRTRQQSLRSELLPQVRRWLDNYKKLKEALEEICELNDHLLRREEIPAKRVRKRT